MKQPKVFVVAGATGGIGGALCESICQRYPDVVLIRLARDPGSLPTLKNRTLDIAFELDDEKSLQQAVNEIPDEIRIDRVFIATGWLHDVHMQPEKTYRSLMADNLAHAFRINSIGPALFIKNLMERNDKKHPLIIGVLSARVGSISDNRLGGWHSYRASKAALNMLIKNFAIEFTRMKRPTIIVGLQPGTTDTDLSAPFQQGVPEGQLQTPAFTAGKLMDVMENLKDSDSGRLFDFLGKNFAP